MSLKQYPATTLTADDATSKEELGSIRIESDGKIYRYIQNNGCTTAVKGDVLKFMSSNNYQATRSATAARRNAFAGVLTSRLSKAKYGWGQFGGFNTYLYTGTSVAAGDALVVNSTTSRIARTMSTTVNLAAFGRTLRADSGSTLTACFLGVS